MTKVLMRRLLASFILLVSLSFVIASCGPRHSNPQVIRLGQSRSIALPYEVSNDPVVRAQVTSAALYTIQCWEATNGVHIPPTFIIVNLSNANGYNGKWHGDVGDFSTLEVWIGEHNELPGLYHEFCHRVFLLFDHSDPRWVQWDINGNKCYHEIDEGR